MEDKDIIKALEWCEQFENNIVMSNRSGEKFILALQAMQIIKQALKEHTCQKAEIEQWKEEANRYQNLWCEAMKDIQTAKSEAIKEFAERLKELPSVTNCEYEWLHLDIDNLVAEMTEGNDNG